MDWEEGPLGRHDLTFVKSGKPITVMNKQETKAAGIEYNNFGRVICGEKKLYVTILNSKVSGGSFTFETANGSVRIFNTECTAAGAPDAIGYAIVKVIHDARVLNYMEQ